MRHSPLGLLAELTYRCPLHCPYCSNPLNLGDYRDELTLEEWLRVLNEAHALGVLQLHLSGGEPLQRLDHVQISIQAADSMLSDQIAGTPSYRRKVEAARTVKKLGFPLTLNVVLHRQNIDQAAAILALAEELAADRLELANTQYYGWALHNRAALLPTWDQLQRAEEIVRAARARLAEQMQIIYVIPDYYSRYPKPCMGGWGRQQLTVTPNGNVLPCPAAAQIAALPIENVRQRSLSWIWNDSPMFNRFRGSDWMPEPCRSCPRQGVDFGGCRCQAFQLTGEAAATDPVCELSPNHATITNVVRAVNQGYEAMPDFIYRH